MEELDQITKTLSLTMGAAWASGINLYAAILVLGILGNSGDMTLPANLQILTHPAVLIAAGFMYAVEFIADKIPGVDTGWDAVSTFIRIPAGAILAAKGVGDLHPALSLAAAILGGGIAGLSHSTKAGSRVLINTSPEPFTNWAASVFEDVVVIGGMWTALHHPYIFLVLLVLMVFFMIWFLPKLWRGIKLVFTRIKGWFGGNTAAPPSLPVAPPGAAHGPSPPKAESIEHHLESLNNLMKKGLISEEEYQKKRQELLEKL
jgi:hypothetical protein